MDKVKANTFMNLSYWARKSPVFRKVKLAAPTDTLTNFPVLIKANPTFNIGTSTGYDVHFQDMSGNELAFELDFYDPVAKTGAWWVRIPALPSNSITTIKMLYGDPEADVNGSAPATLWSDYTYVYHFNSLDNLSSVVGDYTMITGGKVAASMSLVPNILTGRGFRIVVTDGYGSMNFTLSLGNKINTTTGTLTILGTSNTPPYDRVMDINTGWYTYRYMLYGGFKTQAGASQTLLIPFNETNSLYCYGGSTNTSEVSWVVNGVTRDTSSCSPGWLRWDVPQLSGNGYSVEHPSELTLDEVRISATTYRPAAWLHYEQNQIINHSTYTTYGPEIKQ